MDNRFKVMLCLEKYTDLAISANEGHGVVLVIMKVKLGTLHCFESHLSMPPGLEQQIANSTAHPPRTVYLMGRFADT